MRKFFLTVWLVHAANYSFGSVVGALEDDEDNMSLLQTHVLHSTAHRFAAVQAEDDVDLEEIKNCLSQLAEMKELKERDIKISDEELSSIVDKVKDCAGAYGMEKEEYLYFMTYVRDHAPQRLLVWGLGADSIVLDLLNYGGETLFLEPDPNWIEILQDTESEAPLHVVNFDETLFNTTVATYQEFLLSPHRSDAVGPLQGQPCWDTVLIDSPMGSPANPSNFTGRAVPMYTALVDIARCQKEGRYPANTEVSVFVHDSNRPLEDKVAEAFFATANLTHEVGPKKLRQYCFSCSTTSSTPFPVAAQATASPSAAAMAPDQAPASAHVKIDELDAIVNELSAGLDRE